MKPADAPPLAVESSVRLAIGVGFRKACAPETLTALVREARRRLSETHPAMVDVAATLVTITEKDRPPFHEAGAALGMPTMVLSKHALDGTRDRITVASPAAKACFGIPSVAEASALAAAGPGSRLLLTRIAVPQATCAIAASADSVL